MNQTERKSGYYRVKLIGGYDWQLGIYSSLFKAWGLFWDEENYRDTDFEAIDETPINPEP